MKKGNHTREGSGLFAQLFSQLFNQLFKPLFRPIQLVLMLAVTLVSGFLNAESRAAAAVSGQYDFDSGGLTRSYLLHVPKQLAQGATLVIVMHGYTSSASNIMAYSGMNDVAPTGERVEIPLVAIVGFQDGKVAHEHIYWDQASVLVQIGKLDPTGLPVAGMETAKKVVDNSLPSNELMSQWATSKNKPV